MPKAKMANRLLLILVFGVVAVSAVHFRGGTFSWKPTGVDNKVSYHFDGFNIVST